MSIKIKSTTIEAASLPVYTNNDSALAGGLVKGEFYRTPTGEVRVVI